MSLIRICVAVIDAVAGVLLLFVSHSPNEFLCMKCLWNVNSEIGKDGSEMKIWQASGRLAKSKQMLMEAPEEKARRKIVEANERETEMVVAVLAGCCLYRSKNVGNCSLRREC